MRVVDRAIRPLFPKSFSRETSVQAIVLSTDQSQDPAVIQGATHSATRILECLREATEQMGEYGQALATHATAVDEQWQEASFDRNIFKQEAKVREKELAQTQQQLQAHP